ncbi:hypothetical protein AA0323_2685 [Asaia siamensis NRIC 0323]|nr:hypothetical protein AA0323_2685 [Asaia siamensis NRIC 0323]
MKGGERHESLKLPDYLAIDTGRTLEMGPTMDHTVADSRNA